ncbi:MAG: dTMP kinase [Firmicutes bacterium HGW-Firmicutes-14]|jgi:dTMP kinase|nr:MAG: dTMP kinase [Firmicutes bacterium HGW-Firmicutes-14]
MKGLFITFEGPDGSGKTTQMKMLGEMLQSTGKDIVYTREPGGTAISEEIRKILLNPSNLGMVDRTEALLYAAARAQHVEETIRPALKEGKIVLCDRFTDSTLAYQGFGRGIDIDFLKQLNNMAVAGITPDVSLILDINPELGIERISEKRVLSSGGGKDRIELEHINFHRRVRDGFLHIARTEPGRCRIIKADQDRNAVHADIFGVVKEVLDSENP